jgi:hypothetical protein
MVLLADLSIFELAFSNSRCQQNRTINQILFNNDVQICLNENIINEFEKILEETEYFQGFIKELYDNDRIVIEKSNPSLSIKEQFKDIALNSKISFLIPICLNRVEEYIQEIENIVVIAESEKINKNWIAIELLTNSLCNVSYNDFKDDYEIKLFFDNLFKVPKFIKQIKIFNRDQQINYLDSIKGHDIEFYTKMNGNRMNLHFRNETKREMQKVLGRKLKLLFTSNSRIIHERKIIFDNLIVTLDNALENITVEEPTWEIYINYDKQKANTWLDKCGAFYPV